MAIKKKLIHINEFTNFNSMKLSANVNNTQYTVGVDGAVTSGNPDILWQSIVWIKDTKQQWTHGQLYNFSSGVDYTIWFVEDGASEDYVPSNTNYPAVDWDSAEQDAHEGDLFYNQYSKKYWRYESSAWIEITDSNITIEGGSSAYSEVSHGTSDTTFTLTPNTFHVWDEVTSLDLDFGAETSGVANEYLFQFTSGSTATTLTLPDDIKWVNDTAPTIEANKTYQVSVLKGLGSVLEWSNAVDVELIENKATLTTAGMSATVTFQYPVASNLQVTTGSGEATIVAGETEVEVDWSPGDTIISITPISDSTYIYTFDA